MSPDNSPFFHRVVEASGLNPLVGQFTVSRLLLRADADPRTLVPSDLERALPELETGIRIYLDDAEADAALARLRDLAGTAGR